jgi:hypothetical protein
LASFGTWRDIKLGGQWRGGCAATNSGIKKESPVNFNVLSEIHCLKVLQLLHHDQDKSQVSSIRQL